MLVRHGGAGRFAIAARFGVLAPIAGAYADDYFRTYLATTYADLDDASAGLGDWAVRLAVAPSCRFGRVVVRADLGVDRRSGEDEAFSMAHAHLGVGYVEHGNGATLVLQNVRGSRSRRSSWSRRR